MTKSFEIGAYYHLLQEIEVKEVSYATLLKPDAINDSELLAFQKKHPRLRLSAALDVKGLKTSHHWKGVFPEITVMAHHGMELEKECRTLANQGFAVRVAVPSDIHQLASFEMRSLGQLDVQFDLMAFDYVRPVEGCRTNFHTVLVGWNHPSVHQTLCYLQEQGISLNKVHLGVSKFGVMFKNVLPGGSQCGYGEPCAGEQLEKPEMTSDEIRHYLERYPSAKVFYTSLMGCFQSFIYNPANGDWISFDDPKTRASKTEWARRQGLKGVFFY